jgi:hypothetical protein
MNANLPTVEAVRAALAGSPVVHPPASGITPESLNIHQAVKDFFLSNRDINLLFEIGKEELQKKHAFRLMGRRSVQRVEQARRRQEKRGRKPYYPAEWVLANVGDKLE